MLKINTRALIMIAALACTFAVCVLSTDAIDNADDSRLLKEIMEREKTASMERSDSEDIFSQETNAAEAKEESRKADINSQRLEVDRELTKTGNYLF